jgi:hypothetical protein
MLNLGKFDKLLATSPTSIEDYKNYKLTKKEITEIAFEIKVEKNLVSRCLDMLRYIATFNNKEFLKEFKNDVKTYLFNINKADYEPDYIFKNRNGPYIWFHDDEEEFDLDAAKKEIILLQNDQSSNLLI